MSKREAYVVDTRGLPRGDEVSVCRLALRVIADEANTFETDLPWFRATDWPVEVIGAAHRLSVHRVVESREVVYGVLPVQRVVRTLKTVIA